MIGLGSMAKLMRGGLGPDELAEILAAAGMDVQFSPVKKEDALPAFEQLATGVQNPGASILQLRAKMQTGEILSGLLVVNQKS